jgi:GT2 family glycosyltransferase
LHACASSDERISVAQADRNGGIARATNAALALARGEYVGLLDHDDMLTVDAVELVTEKLLAEPGTDLVYSDECTLDTNDLPLAFFSKPDWSPFLLLSCMYTGHLSVYRRALVENLGGFRSGYDFSQDYDLALRVAETNPRVQHLATCLYGWRSIPESAAQDGKPYARQTNIAALQDALDRRAIPASAEALPTSNRFVRHVSARTELVSIIIPSDDLARIYSAVVSIQRHTSYNRYEIIVVTNSRVRDQIKRSRAASAVRCVTYDKPFNFSDKCNAGARKARGNRLVFFNDDVEVVSEDWLEVLLDTVSLDDVGAVAPRLVYADGSTQHAGMVTGVRRLVGTAFHGLSPDSSENFGLSHYAREVSILSAACLMVPADVFSGVGRFDAQNTPIEHSDVDLCLRIRDRGLSCVYTPFATLRHVGHQSLAETGKSESAATRKADLHLLKRWPDRIAYDPYFTPRMRDLHFRDSQETFRIFPGVRSATSEARGDVLLVSHDLSNSGAPRALLDVGRVLKDAGCYVCVCAPADGSMRDQFAAQGIDVIVDELLLTGNPSVLDFAAAFDFAIVNTAVTWRFVAQVSGSVPVYWFFHENELISELARNNHDFVGALRAAAGIWAAGPLPARQVIKLGAPVQTLTYGVDASRMPGDARRRSEDDSVVVGMFGSYEPRKGQDLAVLGVLGMPTEAKEKIRLELWGRVLDVAFANDVRELAAGCTQIYMGPELSPEQCLRQLADSDVVLVPSRDDPLPLVSLDALACSRILVVSRATGTSEYVEHGVSAFILEENSPQEIAKTLTEIVQQGDLCPDVRAAGRAAFEAHFSWERFTAQVHDLLAPELNQLQRSASGRVRRGRRLHRRERPFRSSSETA